MGIGKPWRAALLVGVGLAGGAAAVAVATVPDSSGVIHGCYRISTLGATVVPDPSGPNLRIIDSNAGQTCSTAVGGVTVERPISWNVHGPPGTPGANGKSVTVVAGHTLTIAGGQVITVGGGTAPTYTFTNPLPKPSGKQLTLDIDSMTLPILGFSFAGGGHAASGHGTGGGGGKVRLSDITITKTIDKASPKLALACTNGTHFKKVTITLRSGKKSVKYVLSDVLIAGYQTGGRGSNETPTESITLNFTKEQIQYSK